MGIYNRMNTVLGVAAFYLEQCPSVTVFRAYVCCAIWQGLLLATCEQNLNPARHS